MQCTQRAGQGAPEFAVPFVPAARGRWPGRGCPRRGAAVAAWGEEHLCWRYPAFIYLGSVLSSLRMDQIYGAPGEEQRLGHGCGVAGA